MRVLNKAVPQTKCFNDHNEEVWQYLLTFISSLFNLPIIFIAEVAITH